MKKLLSICVLLCACCFAVMAQGQKNVQNTFLGMTIGKKYSPSKVEYKLMDNSYKQLPKTMQRGEICAVMAYGVSYAGVYWDTATFLLDKHHRLQGFSAQKALESEKLLSQGAELKERLAGKYGEGMQEDGPGYTYIGANDISVGLQVNTAGGQLALTYASNGFLHIVKDRDREL